MVDLRKTLLLPLDDLLAITREFLCPAVSRSGLDRCLRRHGVGNLRDLKPKTPKVPHKPFKAYEPGYVHMDIKYLPQMADESKRRYLFVAIDRATRWVFVAIHADKTAASARRFLRALHSTCPFKITKNRGSFPSDEAVLKLFYLALKDVSTKWFMPFRDWKAALNRFTIQFEERMPQH